MQPLEDRTARRGRIVSKGWELISCARLVDHGDWRLGGPVCPGSGRGGRYAVVDGGPHSVTVASGRRICGCVVHVDPLTSQAELILHAVRAAKNIIHSGVALVVYLALGWLACVGTPKGLDVVAPSESGLIVAPAPVFRAGILSHAPCE